MNGLINDPEFKSIKEVLLPYLSCSSAQNTSSSR